ncbi:MAG: IPT/TIG domain-containing protein [Solirubrobacterales bacterium]
MLAVEDYMGGRRTRRARRSTVLIALLAGAGVLGAFATLPTGANASVTSGALSQLSGEANCVGEEANSSEGNTCGTLVNMGTQDAFQIQLSPDGRNAYSVAINGDLVEYARDPANGHLNVIGCLTAGTDHCAGENVIEDVPDLGHPSSLAVSPDGKSVYVTGTEKHAVVELERNEESGLLTPMNGGKACISEESGGECEFREAKGLNEPYGVTVSPGGEDVYVTAVKGEAIAEFSRGFPEGGPPGLLAPIAGHECIGGSASGCPIETAIGMVEPIGIVVSPDGDNVYVATGAGSSEGAVVAFKREGGVLEQLPGEEGCMSESISGCKVTTALQGSEDLAISADGQNVYATSGPKNALVELKRDESSGALEQLGGEEGCVTTETIVGCTTVSSVGLTRGVIISPRGEDVYVGSAAENGVAAFARGAEGALTPLAGGFECVTSNASGCGTHNHLLGLAEARRLAISPDGTNLYVAGQSAGAIVELARTFTPTVTSVNVRSGSTAGGETVRIKGFGFSEDLAGMTVKFGGTKATTATVSSGTTIVAETPAHSEGTVHVRVENEAGESKETASDDFTYTNRPEVLGVAPAIGGEAGGAEVTIAGLRLSEVTGVRFGPTPAQNFSVNESEDSITAIAPPGNGSVEVGVETKHGSSPAGFADAFTYVDGTPAPAPSAGLFLQGYCEGHGFQSVDLQRETVGGSGFAYENWACVTKDGTETAISNSGGLLSMQAACEEGNPGHTVYAYPTDVNNAYSWGCDVVVPPEEKKSGEGASLPPNELIVTVPPIGNPQLSKTANLAPVEGVVLVQLPGSKSFVSLSTVTQVPFGTVIDATHGRVSVTASEPNGTTETGEYFGGRFKLTQDPNGTVVATLTGGKFSVCPSTRKRVHKAFRGPSARASASRKHTVRKLWTNAHGKFSTRGNYAAGAVQGTEWLTADLCEGTLIKVTRDEVEVTNFVNHKHVLVVAGKQYLAKAG